MDQSVTMNQNVDTLIHNLEDFTQKEGLMGKPVTQGDKTFIPIVSVTLGYGSGNAQGKNQQASMSSGTGAQGLGAKLCTDAIIMIDKGNVSMLPVNASAGNSQLIEKIPQIVSGMTGNKQQGQNQGQGQGQNPSTNWNKQ